MNKIIKIDKLEIANNLPFVLIAGPCQMESREHALQMAGDIFEITKKLGIGFIYKTSFDKANRTSLSGERGIGLEASLPIFSEIKHKFKCPILTDVHSEHQCKIIGEVVDVLQIPAFLCRQTDLLIAAAQTGRVVNVKKGQFLAPWDMANVGEKIKSCGNTNIMFTERGSCFGYNSLVNDMKSIPIMASTSYPIVFDATHSVQKPSSQGNQSGGEREFIAPLARAAVAVGIAAVFIETHQDPDNAPSDGPCMLPISQLYDLLEKLMKIDKIVKNIE